MNEERKPTEKTYIALVVIIIITFLIKYWEVVFVVCCGVGLLASGYYLFKYFPVKQ